MGLILDKGFQHTVVKNPGAPHRVDHAPEYKDRRVNLAVCRKHNKAIKWDTGERNELRMNEMNYVGEFMKMPLKTYT